MIQTRLWPADPQAAERLLNFFLLEKAFHEIEYEFSGRRFYADRSKRGAYADY